MSVRIEGFENYVDELVELEETNEEIPMEDAFTPDFMATYTDFETINQFFKVSPWTVESQADFEAVPADEFDSYVGEHTDFNSWEAMLKVGTREYLYRQLAGIDLE